MGSLLLSDNDSAGDAAFLYATKQRGAEASVGARVHALRLAELLDTPPEEVFDRFTTLASKILGVPVVLVSLVDENRQFFKSQIGLPEPLASLRETPLSHSFCQHVVESQQPLIIADARQNPLVSFNPAIEEIGVVAYAGVPLITPQGQTIGSFCAIDHQPRVWTDHEIEVIQGLAQAVMSEIALRLSAIRFQDVAKQVSGILESITDAFFILDRKWQFVYINEQATQLLGRAREDLLEKDIREEFPHAVGSTFDRQFRRALATGHPVTFEEYFSSLDTWFEVRAYPSKEGLSVYFQDISQRRQSEERLRLLESVVVHANDTVLITESHPINEPGPRILYVNEAFTRMTGYSAEEVLGRSPRFLQGPATQREQLDTLREGLEREHPSRGQLINYRKDGSTFWVEMSIVPITDESGRFTHWISIQRDVTEQKQSEKVLRAAKEEAERANHAKSEFLSRMSHELRTPLNAILGFGQLLETAELSAQDQKSVGYIVRGGQHLLSLINEVLDISSIEVGKLSLELESIDLVQVCSDVVQMMRPQLERARIALNDDFLQLEGICVWADRRRLKQVVMNLLSNAIKYNRKGGQIVLRAVTKGPNAPDGDSFVRLEVQDSGVGIESQEFHKLFTPFERLGAQNSSVEGNGIGLSICKSLIEAMGGQIGAHSQAGVGSIFWLELPHANCSLAESLDALPLSRSFLSTTQTHVILCIEDNLPNLQLLRRIFAARPQSHLITASNLAQGLEMAQTRSPNLILLDLNLPDGSGLDGLRQLQNHEKTRSIPVVVLSADATPEQRERLISAGAREYLTKPYEVNDLLHCVDALIEAEKETSGALSAEGRLIA